MRPLLPGARGGHKLFPHGGCEKGGFPDCRGGGGSDNEGG